MRISAIGSQRLARATKILLLAFGMLALSCLATLMFTFMGGSPNAPDAGALVSLHAAGVVASCVAIVLSLIHATRGVGLAAGLGTLWRHIPGWLVFAAGLAISLVAFGEVAYLVVRHAAPELGVWFNQASLVCLGTASVACVALFATMHQLEGRPEVSKARW